MLVHAPYLQLSTIHIPLLYNFTLERELKKATEALTEHDYYAQR